MALAGIGRAQLKGSTPEASNVYMGSHMFIAPQPPDEDNKTKVRIWTSLKALGVWMCLEGGFRRFFRAVLLWFSLNIPPFA